MDLQLETAEPVRRTELQPVLLVHGAWHGAWCWSETFMPYLAERGYQTHAMSFRGHGTSPIGRSIKVTRASDYVEDLASVIDRLPAKPLVVAHSMGAMVVAKYLEQDDLPGVVMLAPVPAHGLLPLTMKLLWRHPLRLAAANLRWSLKPMVNSPEIVRELLFPDDTPDEFAAAWAQKLTDEAYLGFLDMILFDLPTRAAIRDRQILVLAADNDRLFSVEEQRKTAEAYSAEFEVIPGITHNMMAAPGWEGVANRVTDWFATLS